MSAATASGGACSIRRLRSNDPCVIAGDKLPRVVVLFALSVGYLESPPTKYDMAPSRVRRKVSLESGYKAQRELTIGMLSGGLPPNHHDT